MRPSNDLNIDKKNLILKIILKIQLKTITVMSVGTLLILIIY